MAFTPTHNSKIAVLCGGMSSEREVSLRSGKNCTQALKRLGYTQTVQLDVTPDIALDLRKHEIEVAFLTLHGRYGEDGCIQGLLEIMGIPYTGSRVTASALTIRKDLTKQILASAGLPVAPSVTVACPGNQPPPAEELFALVQSLAFPVMVKPVTEGSSVGMSKVETLPELPAALAEAARYSPLVLVETFICGVDLTVGVIHVNHEPVVTPILQLKSLSKSGWYDLEAKYTEGLTEFTLPAPLSPALTARVQQAALDAHRVMGCYGVSRTDFVCVPEKDVYTILEINTLPGMTDLSDLPAQAQAMGVGYDQLVEVLLKTAC